MKKDEKCISEIFVIKINTDVNMNGKNLKNSNNDT